MTSVHTPRWLVAFCLLLLTASALRAAEPAPTIKALMLVGGDYHDYNSLPVQLADRLTKRSGMTVQVTSDLAGINRAALRDVQVLIINTCHRPPLTDEFKQAILEHLKAGKGLVVVHCSLWSYIDWPEWTDIMGGRVETHDKYGPYEVVVLDPTHPTMFSLGNRFTVMDEPYLVDQPNPDNLVLIETAQARHDTAGKLRPGPDPQAWVKRYGPGRVFVTTLGHDAASQQSEQFITLMHNGIRWAGGLTNDTVHNQLTSSEKQVGFELLFNGKDLTGWKNDGGLWKIEEGQLVGRAQGLDRCNFLLAPREYGDFILRLSFKLVRGNSGVQIRGIEQAADPARPLKGYHVEVVPDKWGSLYDDGGPRQTLSQELAPDKARQLVIADGWNDMTIQAAGPEIIVRVNGVVTTRFKETDPAIPQAGLIGFQLHRGPEPTELRLRDLRIRRITPADLNPQTRPD